MLFFFLFSAQCSLFYNMSVLIYRYFCFISSTHSALTFLTVLTGACLSITGRKYQPINKPVLIDLKINDLDKIKQYPFLFKYAVYNNAPKAGP